MGDLPIFKKRKMRSQPDNLRVSKEFITCTVLKGELNGCPIVSKFVKRGVHVIRVPCQNMET